MSAIGGKAANASIPTKRIFLFPFNPGDAMKPRHLLSVLVSGSLATIVLVGGLNATEAQDEDKAYALVRWQHAFTYGHPLFWAPYSIIGDGG